jgi:type IV secretory pathway VirB9-like protein
MIELRAGEKPYMPAVAWAYPRAPSQRRHVPTTPIIRPLAARNYRYGLTGDTPPWRPISVYDDGRRVYVEFPRGIVQGEMPPIFVIGPTASPDRQQPHLSEHPDRRSPVRRRRAASWQRQQTASRPSGSLPRHRH